MSPISDTAEDTRFWEGVQADYARLRTDPQEWANYVSELAEWDHTTGDGLDSERVTDRLPDLTNP